MVAPTSRTALVAGHGVVRETDAAKRSLGVVFGGDRFPNHPSSVYVRDDLLAAAVHMFFATRVLGPERHDRLRADLRDQPTNRPATRQADQRKTLDRSLADLERREGRLIRTLETQDDPDGLLTDRVRHRLAGLHQERHQIDDQVRQLDSQPEAEPVTDPACSTNYR